MPPTALRSRPLAAAPLQPSIAARKPACSLSGGTLDAKVSWPSVRAAGALRPGRTGGLPQAGWCLRWKRRV